MNSEKLMTGFTRTHYKNLSHYVLENLVIL